MRILALIPLSLILLSTTSCQRAVESNSSIESVEQLALNVFCDSVLFKPIYKDKNDIDQIEIIYSNNIDTAWIEKGIFFGYSMLADKYASKLSKPDIDTLTYIRNQDIFNDSAKEEISGYWNYMVANKSDTTRVTLQFPDYFKISSLKDFFEKKSIDKIFIQVNKVIKSKATEMVHISAYKCVNTYPFYVTFNFRFVLNKDTNKYDWTFF